MLYIRVWEGEGDETDWVTLTPDNPDECDSSEFDEGMCTGFHVPYYNTKQFISELIALMNRHQVAVNLI